MSYIHYACRYAKVHNILLCSPNCDNLKICILVESPFGHIPVLSVDGTEVCGSVNIARFVAERHGKVMSL